MIKGKIFDIVFIIFSFGIYIIMLNLDQKIDNCNIVCRHIWLPLIIAYFVGRFVSYYNYKNKA